MKINEWIEKNIPDQSGKIVIITGASSGLGLETARILASKNAELILACRNLSKGNEAINLIKNDYPESNLYLMQLDLSDLSSIKNFSDEFHSKFVKLDILINNAGLMAPPYSKTKDGFELQIGTNHFGHFALTSHLFDLLENTPNSRIVNVSSNAHKMGKINLNDINWEKRKYRKWLAYGASKIANLHFTYELKERIINKKKNVLVAAAHPGYSITELSRNSPFFHFMYFIAQSSTMGALPILYAATATDVKNGDYFGPSGPGEWKGFPKKVKSNKLSQNKEINKKLWEISERLTKTRFNIK